MSERNRLNPIDRELQKEIAKDSEQHHSDCVSVEFGSVEELKIAVWNATVDVVVNDRKDVGINAHCVKALDFCRDVIGSHIGLAAAAAAKFEKDNGRRLEGNKEDMRVFISDVCEVAISGAAYLCVHANKSEPLPTSSEPLLEFYGDLLARDFPNYNPHAEDSAE